MKDYLILVIKGFIFGIANIIPGVSGGTLAITLGFYEDLINAISHFFENWKKHLKLIIPIGVGCVLSVLLMSKIINYSLDKFPFPTTLFFIGLILGGIPLLYKRVRKNKVNLTNGIIFAIAFAIVITFTFLQSGNNVFLLVNLNFLDYIILFLVGMVAAAVMVIPGISGSFVLMLLGFYKPIVEVISSLTKFNQIGQNLLILIPFGIGILVGIVLIAKLIEFLFKKFEVKTYFAILGFVIASIVAIVKP